MINNVLSLPIEEEDDDDDGGWVLPMLGPVINSINSLDTLGDLLYQYFHHVPRYNLFLVINVYILIYC